MAGGLDLTFERECWNETTMPHNRTPTIRKARKRSASINAKAMIVDGETPVSIFKSTFGRAEAGATDAVRMV